MKLVDPFKFLWIKDVLFKNQMAVVSFASIWFTFIATFELTQLFDMEVPAVFPDLWGHYNLRPKPGFWFRPKTDKETENVF